MNRNYELDKLPLTRARRIGCIVGSVVLSTTAYFGALTVVDGALRTAEHLIDGSIALAQPVHTVVELVVPDALESTMAEQVNPLWDGVLEAGIGLGAVPISATIAHGLRREAQY